MQWEQLTGVKLTFADFVLVGILCAIMYGLSSIEIRSMQFERNATDRQIADLKLATLSAFLGIPLSLICGVVAESGALGHFTGLLAVAPVILVIAFWVKHHRYGSQLLDADGFAKHATDYYSYNIMTFVQSFEATSKRWPTEEQIFDGCKRSLLPHTALKMISMTEAGKNLSVQMGIDQLVETLAFDRVKMREILEALITRQLLKREAGAGGVPEYVAVDREEM
jgi:hypothetical protein